MATDLRLQFILIHVPIVIACSIAERSLDEVESELCTLRDKLEGVQTYCKCSETQDVEDMLCTLNRDIESLRQQCECMAISTSDYTSWESSTSYPTDSSTEYPEGTDSTTSDYTPWDFSTSYHSVSSTSNQHTRIVFRASTDDVESALSKLRDKLEGVRTDCTCGETRDVEDMLCTLNRGIDALRQQCECQATNMASVTPEYTSPEISSPYPSIIFNTDYQKETEYTTPEYTSWETSKSYPTDSSTKYPEACYRPCPNWTTEFQNHCYFMVDWKTTWGDAGVWCGFDINGSYLVETESEEENTFIIDLWNSTTIGKPIDKGPWIGGYRFSSTNNFQFWIWLRSFRAFRYMYNNWYNSENEPLGEDGKNCVRYVGEDVNTGECVLKWNNYDCDTVAPYICEMDLVDGSNTNFP